MNTKPTSDCPGFPLSSVSSVFTYDWQYLIHLLCKYYVLCTLLAGTTIYLSWRYSIHYLYVLFIWLTNMWLVLKYACAKMYNVWRGVMSYLCYCSLLTYIVLSNILFCYVFFAHNHAKYVLSIWVTDGMCLLKSTWVHSRFLVRYMLLFFLVFCSVLCFLILFVFVPSVSGLSILVCPFGFL